MHLESEGRCLAFFKTVILVPERALQEPGYIQMVQDEMQECDRQDKHRYQALAQMIYFQFQDGELEYELLQAPAKLHFNDGCAEIRAGMCLGMKENGCFAVFQVGSCNINKLIEITYRYCTRWIRLDI